MTGQAGPSSADACGARIGVLHPDDDVSSARANPSLRNAFRNLVGQGWTDAIRSLHPVERIYTFWDYLRNAWDRDAGLRLDLLLLSPNLADRLIGAEVDRDVRGWDLRATMRPSGSRWQARAVSISHH